MNNSNIIDISVPLSSNLPTWPGGYGLKISRLLEIGENSEANVSRLDFDVHCGTHIDAPMHFVKNGKSTDQLKLEKMIGNCYVADLPESISTITSNDLDKLNIPKGITRVLLKTSNSHNNLWDSKEFNKDFCAITNDAAEWIVKNQIELIGIDYCSIQKFLDSSETHQILLENAVIILEGLDLRNVDPGNYYLICLPISINGIEGAPVRAILQNIND